MIKLIPLDAAIACLTETFKGIGEREIDAIDGWWETSSECDFGADRLNTAIVGLQTLPTIDPTAIHEAAIREAVKSLRDWQSELNRHLLMDTAVIVGIAADVVEALIGEKK